MVLSRQHRLTQHNDNTSTLNAKDKHSLASYSPSSATETAITCNQHDKLILVLRGLAWSSWPGWVPNTVLKSPSPMDFKIRLKNFFFSV